MKLGYMVKEKDISRNYDLILFYSPSDAFSNFFQSSFILDGKCFNCVEQYFQYKKAEFFNDKTMMKLILRAKDPALQKCYGYRIAHFKQHKWEPVSLKIMKKACYNKFTQNPELKELLLSTDGCILAEASKYDRKWGIGFSKWQKSAFNIDKWRGQNLLGSILMRTRDKLLWERECNDKNKICYYLIEKKI